MNHPYRNNKIKTDLNKSNIFLSIFYKLYSIILYKITQKSTKQILVGTQNKLPRQLSKYTKCMFYCSWQDFGKVIVNLYSDGYKEYKIPQICVRCGSKRKLIV